ncbi:acyltransferase [Bradyrhizobium sp. SSUT18]|uniref:acyltransferase family protein n=1 Tax=Bradyrhizobium sp. SSUT18 TaxID=3040602 RepID=UPI00244CAFF6|nr:acyltransferase [Bradyrhizobium sp. SSUT18]MDH2399245.1 acyltransferase [Bradyrhizobium sp. SSUT18]
MDKDQLPGIQAGRAVAALSVLYFHSYVALGYFDPASLHTWSWLATYGATGVDLFFAISGFIICLVAERPGFTRGDFALRRALRIYPLNALVTVAMLVMFSYRIAGSAADIEPLRILRSLLILPQHAPINSVGWTLELEVAFYLVAVVLLPIGGRFLLLAYCVASGLVGNWLAPESPWIARFIGGHYLDFGAGIAAWIAIGRTRQHWPLSIIMIACGVGAYLAGGRLAVSEMTPLACGLVVAGLAVLPAVPRPLLTLGNISYGVYLIHWPIMNLATWYAFTYTPARDLGEAYRWLTIGLVILMAGLSWVLFERPLIRLGRRRKQPPPAFGKPLAQEP